LLGRQVAHEVSQIGTAILNLNRFGNNKWFVMSTGTTVK
jgi:hypothetical protein